MLLISLYIKTGSGRIWKKAVASAQTRAQKVSLCKKKRENYVNHKVFNVLRSQQISTPVTRCAVISLYGADRNINQFYLFYLIDSLHV